MKKNRETFTDKEWMALASLLSEEQIGNSDISVRFMAEDKLNTTKHWKELKEMKNEKEINVDLAWEKVMSKLNADQLKNKDLTVQKKNIFRTVLKIAAVCLIILGLGLTAIYIDNKGVLSTKSAFASAIDQRNLQVKLPDGSIIYLNRNSKLSYRASFGRKTRSVILKGEAFFEIVPDETKPFIVDAGKAGIKVVGTSFNVISENRNNEVEVFVKTGRVMLYEISGTQNLILEQGYIGTMDSKLSAKTFNYNPNYMSWNTGLLEYSGQKLNTVFSDLKRVYDMDIVADDPGILNEAWTSHIDNLTEETIIRLICSSFNLSYSKDGNVYHLNKK